MNFKKRYMCSVIFAFIVVALLEWSGFTWRKKTKMWNIPGAPASLSQNEILVVGASTIKGQKQTNRSSDRETQTVYQPSRRSQRHGDDDRRTYRYRDMDTSRQLSWKYDRRFKNPCWYENGTLNCLPYFFIIGVKKCGTTSLYARLLRHPESVYSEFKEASFFGWKTIENRAKTESISTYIDLWSPAVKHIQEYSRVHNDTESVNKLIFCDASPEYIFMNRQWKKLPGNTDANEPTYVVLDYIHAILPKAKLIVVFRDPVERLYSEYIFNARPEKAALKAPNGRNNTVPSPELFHDFVIKEIRSLEECLKEFTLRSCAYSEDLTPRVTVGIVYGLYHVYWEELIRVFPRDQIHVVQMGDIDSKETMRRAIEFLEMSPASDAVYQSMLMAGKRNERPTSLQEIEPMLNKTRNVLYDFYRPYNRRMAKLTGDKTFLYPKK